MTSIQMPQLGETIVEGTILKWLKREGDAVARDEPLFEISTDKVDTEVPSPVAGTVTKILVDEGATVPVGTALMEISEAGGAASGDAASGGAASSPASGAAPTTEPAPAPLGAPPPQRDRQLRHLRLLRLRRLRWLLRLPWLRRRLRPRRLRRLRPCPIADRVRRSSRRSFADWRRNTTWTSRGSRGPGAAEGSRRRT